MYLKGIGVQRSCPNSLMYLRAAGEFGSWGSVLREGFDAYLGRADGHERDDERASLLYDLGFRLPYIPGSTSRLILRLPRC